MINPLVSCLEAQISSLPRRSLRWAVVLAAGEGRRLQSMTRGASGKPVPKQFWAPDGRATMLERTLARADRLVSPEHIATVVAEQHRQWWSPILREKLLPENIVTQPKNRGTAAGILLPILRIAGHNPAARVVILPSDHGVTDEWTLQTALEEAFAAVERRPQRLVLLGMPGQTADSDYGWITPAAADGSPVRAIREFVEKPTRNVARRLLGEGALISSFLMVADVTTLLDLYARFLPELWTAFSCHYKDEKAGPSSLDSLYDTLQTNDFSRDLLTAAIDSLDVLPVRPCGWSDLGTPERVRQYRLAVSKTRQAKSSGFGTRHVPINRPWYSDPYPSGRRARLSL